MKGAVGDEEVKADHPEYYLFPNSKAFRGQACRTDKTNLIQIWGIIAPSMFIAPASSSLPSKTWADFDAWRLDGFPGKI